MAPVRRLRVKESVLRSRTGASFVIGVEHDGTVTATFDGDAVPLLHFDSMAALLATFGLTETDLESDELAAEG